MAAAKNCSPEKTPGLGAVVAVWENSAALQYDVEGGYYIDSPGFEKEKRWKREQEGQNKKESLKESTEGSAGNN